MRSILMAHSLHFREMFTNTAAEEFHTGVAHEKTLPEAVLDVLIYCYYGGFTSVLTWPMEISMFQLADKYSMTGMKIKLENCFIRWLKANNVLTMAELADTHSAEDLKKVG